MDLRELTARNDVQKWALYVQSDLETFKGLEIIDRNLMRPGQIPSTEHQRFKMRISQAIDALWRDGAQWYKAVDSLPRPLRKTIDPPLDRSLRETVRHLRNITEHWEDTRPWFLDPTRPMPPKSRRSIEWYVSNFPDEHPWTWTWVIGQGYRIAGVLNPDALLAEIQAVDAALAA